MYLKSICTALIFTVVLSGSLCAQSDHASDAREYIEAANAQISKLLSEKKFDEAGKYYAPDVVQMVAGSPTITSRTQWVQSQKEGSMIGDWNLALEVVDVEACDNIAVERGVGIMSFAANDKSPMESFTMKADYMVMWKRDGDKWLIQWDYVVAQPPVPGN